MESTPRLYDTLVAVLRQHQNWLDRRHLKTLAWMTVGLMPSGTSSLTAWVPSVHRRAVDAQRVVRRFARWLEHARIDVHALDGPRLQQALAEWGHQGLYLALDTSMWWQTSGVVRLSRVSRGRAIPLVWTVLAHASRRGTYEVYQGLLEQVAERLPFRCHVVLTADRGCADTHRMAQLVRLSWHGRLRLNGSCWIYQPGKRPGQVRRLPLSPGQALFWPPVYLTTQA